MSYDYTPYRSVASRQAKAKRDIRALKKQGYDPAPVEPFSGLKIATTFWGHAWCRHLEEYVDEDHHLPRGRSYVRHGAVCHLAITQGVIEAIVSGSSLYESHIEISPLSPEHWDRIKQRCSGKIGSLIDLLQGKLSDEVMAIVTDPSDGLFPSNSEIRLSCNCPDWSQLCKHLAAALYAVGRRLDQAPELLFTLRGVDHRELIESSIQATATQKKTSRRRLDDSSLASVFGIELAPDAAPEAADSTPRSSSVEPVAPRLETTTPKKTAKKRGKVAASKPPPSPQTGAAVRKLRLSFEMSPYEFALIMDRKTSLIETLEATGRHPHGAKAADQAALDEIASLSLEEAQLRLARYR